MLQRLLSKGTVATVATASLGLALSQCGSTVQEREVTQGQQAIVGGIVVDTPDSPVLYLRGPEGTCTSVLVGTKLVATARHCVGLTTAGSFACTSDGELIITGNGAGEIGADVAPQSLEFYSWRTVSTRGIVSGQSDAIGARILSTNTFSACRDDLAFVVLDRSIPGITPLRIRLDVQTYPGETVSVLGYGLTSQVESLALRTRSDAEILAVGPDMPASTAQLAPVRAVRTGPVTCQGDSGGPIVSSNGEVIAVVSLGSQAGAAGPYCNDNGFSGTIGPRLAAYRSLIFAAYDAAGESLVDAGIAVDSGEMSEPSNSGEPSSSDDAGSVQPDAGAEIPPPDPVDESPVAPGCAVSARSVGGSRLLGMTAIAIALGALARGRRRGHGRSS